MTHKELVKRARKWLRNSIRCGVVLAEQYSTAPEVPDAIGWKSYTSYLVECKTTRADFERDRSKYPRRCPDVGMGEFRYYMAEPGLLDPGELPEGWGLLEVYPRYVRTVKRAKRFPCAEAALAERSVLYAALRRYKGG